ncbi:MAG: hypothetical protein LBB55_03675 [Zoogloeaceae bacterium]|jgi:hypothetical protein|nr:hypothetical protein [Zoogloeaceae bacterium]
MNLRRWWDDFCYDLETEARRLVRLFLRPTTWVVIIALLAFALELYFGMIVALRYDGLMHLLGVSTLHCRVLENWQYLVIIYVLFASGVALLYCLGNFVSWARAREHRQQYPEEARRLAWLTFSCAVAVECIGGLAIWLLLRWC